MFSAVKFVAAGVIVALFGGFLLTGVLTTQQGDEVVPAAVTDSPSPLTNDEVLPGVTLTVEEVEPGVFRVVNDGVRDVSSATNRVVVAGRDGGIWVIRGRRFFRLGAEGTHKPPKRGMWDFGVAPDGTVWAIGEGSKQDSSAIRSFDGERWTVQKMSPKNVAINDLEVTSDGTVWAIWQDKRAVNDGDVNDMVVGRLGDDGWQPLDQKVRSGEDLFVTDSGDIWVGSKDDPFTDGYGHLDRYVEGVWQEQPIPVGEMDIGADGTVWLSHPDDWIGFDMVFGGLPLWPVDGTMADTSDDANDTIARFDGTEWREWDTADGVPLTLKHLLSGDSLRAAPDGSLWVSRWLEDMTCDGVARFDGTTWVRYLRDQCVRNLDIAADGSVWGLAAKQEDDAEFLDLYVITLEAVAATE